MVRYCNTTHCHWALTEHALASLSFGELCRHATSRTAANHWHCMMQCYHPAALSNAISPKPAGYLQAVTAVAAAAPYSHPPATKPPTPLLHDTTLLCQMPARHSQSLLLPAAVAAAATHSVSGNQAQLAAVLQKHISCKGAGVETH